MAFAGLEVTQLHSPRPSCRAVKSTAHFHYRSSSHLPGLQETYVYRRMLSTHWTDCFGAQYVEKGPAPSPNGFVPAWWDSQTNLTSTPYQYVGQGQEPQEPAPIYANPARAGNGHHANGKLLISRLARLPNELVLSARHCRANYPLGLPTGDAEAGMIDAIPAVAQARMAHSGASAPQENGNTRRGPQNTRRVPEHPVLSPANRYCYKEGFVKPPRAHHCSACGTVRMSLDPRRVCTHRVPSVSSDTTIIVHVSARETSRCGRILTGTRRDRSVRRGAQLQILYDLHRVGPSVLSVDLRDTCR